MAQKVTPEVPRFFGKVPPAVPLAAGLLACGIILGAGPVGGTAEGPASVRSYTVPDHGSLELVVPNHWQHSTRQPARGRPPTIMFSPRSGDDFQVLLTPGWDAGSKPGFNSPQEIRRLLEGRGKNLLGQSAEKTLVLEELSGREAVGYAYSLTDRDPKPGEYRYMTQGAVGVGDLLVLFTILYKDKNAPERQAALDMVKTARQRAKK